MARLVPVQSSCPHAERFMLCAGDLRHLPFFGALESFLEDLLCRDQNVSYVIWGGVAANLALALTARSGIHYSFHDIELLLTKNGVIHSPDGLLDRLNERLSTDSRFLMELGGRVIARTKEGLPIAEWQRERIYLNDGDLHLNNVIFIVDRTRDEFFVETPIGTIQSLLNGDATLSMKDASDLRDIHRLARRIYRTISKVIRLEQVAGLRLSPEAVDCLCGLIDVYNGKLDGLFSHLDMDTAERETAYKWISETEINSAEEGREWIYVKTVCETVKRLAGLFGLSSVDQTAFRQNFFVSSPESRGLLDHYLLRLLEGKLPDPHRFGESGPKSDLFDRCYAELGSYQKPGAECLRTAYSLDPPAAHINSVDKPH